MDRYHIEPDEVRRAHGIADKMPESPCSGLDGVSISCSLGNGCKSDRLFSEQETAAMYDEPLGSLWLFIAASRP